jgi:hypothetical protein
MSGSEPRHGERERRTCAPHLVLARPLEAPSSIATRQDQDAPEPDTNKNKESEEKRDNNE